MRHETRQRLDRELHLQRLKFAGAGMAIIAAVAAGFVLVDLEAHETKVRAAGVVEKVRPYASKGVSDGVEVGVKLADGRHVTVLANRSHEPHVGDAIEVTEHRHLSGRTTFTYR